MGALLKFQECRINSKKFNRWLKIQYIIKEKFIIILIYQRQSELMSSYDEKANKSENSILFLVDDLKLIINLLSNILYCQRYYFILLHSLEKFSGLFLLES